MTQDMMTLRALLEKSSDAGAVTVTGWCQLRVASSFLL